MATENSQERYDQKWYKRYRLDGANSDAVVLKHDGKINLQTSFLNQTNSIWGDESCEEDDPCIFNIFDEE